MTNFIPEETIRAIENAADIIEVVSESVVLKKAGKNYVGLCPFHSEKTPSFTVNPDKQIFHCFGCGVGGNIFNFLMKQDGMSFPDAARMLARRCGIDIPTPQMAPAQKRLLSEKENLYALNRRVMEFYQHMLIKSASGENARRYLTQRGMTNQIIDTFKLGYVPGRWDSLVNFFCQKQNPPGPGSKIRSDYHKRKQQQNLGPFQGPYYFSDFQCRQPGDRIRRSGHG